MPQLTLNPSVLDTKETFLHFSQKSKGSKDQKNHFFKAHYRYRNLYTAHLLELSKFVDHDQVNRTIRNLRYCRSIAIVEKKKDNTAAINSTSKTCKNPHCALCARARSTKLALRLISAITDQENSNLLNEKYFYFLTLTVQHNETNRNEIYLKEFNQYCNKLFRSKTFANAFEISKETKSAGWIKCTECTFSKTGFHIHAHIIICSNKLKQKVNYVQNSLKTTWKKITKDSDQIRLDLIKDLKTNRIKNQIKIDQKKVIAAVKELFKYGTKTGKIHSKDIFKIDNLAKWIIATKGQNFVNASGLFRGLNLTGSKSKYDTKYQPEEQNLDSKYFAGQLSKILFNIPTNKNYNKDDRLKYLENVNITAITSEFSDITSFYDEFIKYKIVGLTEKETGRYVAEWIESIKEQLAKEREEQTEIQLTKEQREKAIQRMKAQQKIPGL